jgi:signal transduction histidine kinase
VTLLIFLLISLGSCIRQSSVPTVEFTRVPLAEAGNPNKLVPIAGRVSGAQPGQRVVLYAKAADTWWVQPLAIQPFTEIQSNSKWRNSVHPGTDYAALLVGPDFQPPSRADTLPTAGVIASAVTPGAPVWWRRWWFPVICLSAAGLIILAIHRLRLHQTAVRFEERFAERTRVTQELHDTLLQGVIGASMQLQVVLDQLPSDSPAQPGLNHVLRLMGQVVEEGRNTVRGLRSSIRSVHDLEQVISNIGQELNPENQKSFRVIVEGRAAALQPAICNDVYGISREALLNAFRHSRARDIEVELGYARSQLRLLVRDNGCGIDANVLRSRRSGPGGLRTMRQRAERIGGKLKVLSSAAGGTEVELRVPGRLAFESHRSTNGSKWWSRLHGQHERTSDPVS